MAKIQAGGVVFSSKKMLQERCKCGIEKEIKEFLKYE